MKKTNIISALLLGAISCNSMEPMSESAISKMNNIRRGKEALNKTFFLAVQRNQPKEVEKLIKEGANYSAKENKTLRTAMHVAAEVGAVEILFQLSSRDRRLLQQKDYEGNTPLHYAAAAGQVEAIEWLVRRCAHKNETNNVGLTPFMFCVVFKQMRAMFTLYKLEADIYAEDIFGESALHIAAATCGSFCKPLLEWGLKPNVRGNEDKTPLHYAAMRGDWLAIKALLDGKAYPNNLDRACRTPLHYAAKKSDLAVDALLQAGKNKVKLDVQDMDGNTPLHLSLTYGKVPAALALIEAGSQYKIKNKDGDTARDLAERFKL